MPVAPAQAQDREPVMLQVGHIPILPMAQLFVMLGEGWVEETGLAFELTRFSSVPACLRQTRKTSLR